MATALEKVRRLEQYLTIDGATTHTLLDMALDKLLSRENRLMLDSKQRLLAQLEQFEQEYGLASKDFYQRYERGEMGDDLDYVEWAATIDMLINIEKRVNALTG